MTRPALHFTAGRGWVNDPHAITYHDGRYHLFYQHVPDSTEWHVGIHWGHATSTDLLHWEERPVVLSPGDGDTGIWSGSLAISDSGEPVIFYTSATEPDLGRARVRLAHPTDDTWDTWKKGEVVAGPQRDSTHVFRDPMVYRDGDGWTMLVGVGEDDGNATADVFTSADLLSWTYDGRLASRHASMHGPWTGTAWECPQLLRVPGGDVLLVSVWEEHVTHVMAAAVGRYAGRRLAVDSWQDLTAGPGHYAGSRFVDAEGRECVLFWIRGITDAGGGWAGAMSVPYVLSVEDGRVVLTPHPVVESARGERTPRHAGALDLEWRPGDSGQLVLTGDDGAVRAELTLADGQLSVAVTNGHKPVVVPHTGPVLRVLVDGPVLEVVASGGLVGLPLRPSAHGVLPAAAQGTLTWWPLG